jgi:hypothetical protein
MTTGGFFAKTTSGEPPMSEAVTLEFLGRQSERVLNELAGIRSDLTGVRTETTDVRGSIDVLTAMAMRHDNTMRTVITELQSIHQLNARIHDRLQKLEANV